MVTARDKGLFYSYTWLGIKQIAESYWVQKEYAAVFAEQYLICRVSAQLMIIS